MAARPARAHRRSGWRLWLARAGSRDQRRGNGTKSPGAAGWLIAGRMPLSGPETGREVLPRKDVPGQPARSVANPARPHAVMAPAAADRAGRSPHAR